MADPNCSRCAVEAEVRKQDTQLIRQLLSCLTVWEMKDSTVDEIIAAANARLEQT